MNAAWPTYARVTALTRNVYCNPHYEPEPQMLAGIHMDGLVPYLRGSHAYYVDNRLPHIARHLDHIATQLPERVAAVFKRFFEEYQQEVMAHFAHEEQVVFPHIEALTAGRPTTVSCETTPTLKTNSTTCCKSSSNTCPKTLPVTTP